MKHESSEEDEFVREERNSAEKYAKSLAQYENALALDKPSSLFRILKIPGIVFFAGVGGYVLGWLDFRPWIVIPLLYVIGFVFLSRIKEFKRSMEAFVYFSIRKQTVSKYEKVDWMNEVIEKAWRYVESNVSKELLLRVGPILRKVKVPMISDIRLDRFTLGGQAPVVEGIRVRHSSKESLILDVAMHFIPAIGEEMHSEIDAPEGIKTNWNSNITLTIRIGSAGAGIDMPITLKNVSFRGSVRIKLNFTYDTTVIEGAEFSFLKQPVIGFNILPLKILDIMDVPGLATAIRKVVEIGIEKEVLYPKKISVALKPKSKYYVGALVVHIHKVVSQIKSDIFMSVGLNGRKGKDTLLISRDSSNFLVYLPIKNTDEFISINLHRKEDEVPVATASVQIEQICMRSRAQGILPFSNKQGYIDASIVFYPKVDVDKIGTDETPRSAIVTVKLAQLIDMVDIMGVPYKNLSVKATVSLRQKRIKNKDPADMSAAELMPDDNTSPGFSVTNESSTDSDEEIRKKSPATAVPNEILGVFTTGVVKNVTSPAFDEKFVFYTRDAKRTTITVEAYDKNRALGSFSVNIRRGISISYGTFDFWHMPAGRAKLLFSAEYAFMIKVGMQKYTHIRAVKMERASVQGIFTGYFVTNGRVVPAVPFLPYCSSEYNGYTFVPLLSTDEVTKYVAYMNEEVYGGCDVEQGESYIGDTQISISVKEYRLDRPKDDVSVSTPDNSVENTDKSLKASSITQVDPVQDIAEPNTAQDTAQPNTAQDIAEPNTVQDTAQDTAQDTTQDTAQDTVVLSPFIQMRVIVCRVNHPIFLEFSKDDVVVDRSASSTGKKLFGEFYFFSNVSISVYTVKEGFLIGKLHLSHSSGRHEIKLTHGQLIVIDVYNRVYSGTPRPIVQKGTLSLSILNMEISELSDPEVYASVFVEVAAGDKSLTTPSSKNISSPEFNSTFSFDLFTPTDSVEIRVFGWTLLKEKKFLGEIVLPGPSIPPGSSSISADIPAMLIDSTAPIYKINANMIFQ